ncbi:MAG: SET domain-containing protein-lysine N-methyltransferase [bacterium]|nr:SET domain-containing protein-lysine N-methyltransferase [bacterium]
MDNLHNRWSHRWLNPKAEALFSGIAGTGVFAKEKIMKGEPVGVLGGIIVLKKDILEYRAQMTHVGIQIDDNFFIVPTEREELEKYGVFNHSCEPNVGYANSITFAAMRDIEVGEELVFDYAFSESFYDGFDCHCGLPVCRQKVTPDDWQRKDLQEKYSEHFSPYLRKKFGK